MPCLGHRLLLPIAISDKVQAPVGVAELAEASKAKVLLLLQLLSVSDMDSWLLSRHIWEKRGPAELCPLPCEYKQQLSTLSALLWYPYPNEVPSTNLAIASLQADIPSGQCFLPLPFHISCIYTVQYFGQGLRICCTVTNTAGPSSTSPTKIRVMIAILPSQNLF